MIRYVKGHSLPFINPARLYRDPGPSWFTETPILSHVTGEEALGGILQLGLGSASAVAGFRVRRRGQEEEQRQEILTLPFTPDEPRFLAGARRNKRDAVILLLDAHEIAMCGCRPTSRFRAPMTASGRRQKRSEATALRP